MNIEDAVISFPKKPESPSATPLDYYINAEVSGTDGPLGRHSTEYEYVLAKVIDECAALLKACVEQIEEYSENELIIGNSRTIKINDLKRYVGTA